MMTRFDHGRAGSIFFLFSGILLVLRPTMLAAAPGPGDLFREYRWTNENGDAGGSLRVGGRVGYGGDAIPIRHDVDLAHATRVVVVVA